MKKAYKNPEMYMVSMDSINLLLPLSGKEVGGGYAPRYERRGENGKLDSDEEDEEEEDW